MAKILFDIAAHEPSGLQEGHLLLEVSQHIFSYTATDSEQQLLHLRIFELDTTGNQDLAGQLAAIISNDGLLKSPARKNTIVYNFPESQLVPEAYFQSGQGKNMVNLLHGDLNKGIVLSERIPGRPQYNVYQVPAEAHHLMQRSFANSKFWHYYTLWIPLLPSAGTWPDNFISVLFYPNRILVKVVKEQQLHLLQSFTYEAAEDAGYHLLNICLQLNQSPETTPIILSGMIDGSSTLYTEINKYFGQVSLDTYTGAASAAALEEYPAHFFSPLLKLTQCV